MTLLALCFAPRQVAHKKSFGNQFRPVVTSTFKLLQVVSAASKLMMTRIQSWQQCKVLANTLLLQVGFSSHHLSAVHSRVAWTVALQPELQCHWRPASSTATAGHGSLPGSQVQFPD